MVGYRVCVWEARDEMLFCTMWAVISILRKRKERGLTVGENLKEGEVRTCLWGEERT